MKTFGAVDARQVKLFRFQHFGRSNYNSKEMGSVKDVGENVSTVIVE
jgi:hypothetical protein